jgi:hypothetical protein
VVHFFLREDLRVFVEAVASGTFFFLVATLRFGLTPAAIAFAGRTGVGESEREEDVDAVGDV